MNPFFASVVGALWMVFIMNVSVVMGLSLPFFSYEATSRFFRSTTSGPPASNADGVTTSLPPNYAKYMITFKKSFDVSNNMHVHTQKLLTLFRHAAMVFVQNAEGQPVLEDFDIGDLKGYMVTLDRNVANDIRAMEEVDHVEEDGVVRTYDIQQHAPWGLSRISHRDFPSPHGFDYHYVHGAGHDVTVYIIDTGIHIHHVDFEGRARWGKTIPQNNEDHDGNGHGTHCAGIVGSRSYGVAKNATLVAVKVLSDNGAGSTSDVIKGIEWVVKDHKARSQKDKKKTVSVANMSLGGSFSKTLNRVVNAAVKHGIHFAVAAGNDNANACSYSPASAKKAITVGASTDKDNMARFSNHGHCVDVFAPGQEILSTWIGSKTAVATLSGTSMASPHVAGAVAYLLSMQIDPTSLTPHALKKKLMALTTRDHLHNLPDPSRRRTPPPFPFPFPPGNGDGDGDGDDDDDEGETLNRLLYIGNASDVQMAATDTPLMVKATDTPLHIDETDLKVVYRNGKISPLNI